METLLFCLKRNKKSHYMTMTNVHCLGFYPSRGSMSLVNIIFGLIKLIEKQEEDDDCMYRAYVEK